VTMTLNVFITKETFVLLMLFLSGYDELHK